MRGDVIIVIHTKLTVITSESYVEICNRMKFVALKNNVFKITSYLNLTRMFIRM